MRTEREEDVGQVDEWTSSKHCGILVCCGNAQVPDGYVRKADPAAGGSYARLLLALLAPLGGQELVQLGVPVGLRVCTALDQKSGNTQEPVLEDCSRSLHALRGPRGPAGLLLRSLESPGGRGQRWEPPGSAPAASGVAAGAPARAAAGSAWHQAGARRCVSRGAFSIRATHKQARIHGRTTVLVPFCAVAETEA